MPEEISLKLCLLTSLEERSREEVENDLLVSVFKNDSDDGDGLGAGCAGMIHEKQ